MEGSAPTNLNMLDAVEVRDRLDQGAITAEALVASCLARIEEREDEVGAWAHLDPGHALAQARRLDQTRAAGRDTGPLHGLPVAVKDIVDTADLPTENGTPIMAGRQPKADAAIVAQLRQAGAVVLGKTVTTEFAMYAPGKTRNPHDPARTPGGSSSGSAAAVADFMAPLAIGSQTNGSIVRPASFCGVYGYKPTLGLISRHGVLSLSPPLDTIGVFGRSVEDAALLAEALMTFDPRDRDMRPRARPRLLDTTCQDPPVAPQFAVVRSPAWEKAEADTRNGFEELIDFLGETADVVELPEIFDRAIERHRAIMVADLARNLAVPHQRSPEKISDALREMIEEGQGVTAVDYNAARDWQELFNAGLDEIFKRYDAILTPAAPGEAPADLTQTGDPCFCSLWTLCGVPAVSLPLLQGSHDMPIGVQAVGPRFDDGRLLRTARWLARTVTAGDEQG